MSCTCRSPSLRATNKNGTHGGGGELVLKMRRNPRAQRPHILGSDDLAVVTDAIAFLSVRHKAEDATILRGSRDLVGRAAVSFLARRNLCSQQSRDSKETKYTRSPVGARRWGPSCMRVNKASSSSPRPMAHSRETVSSAPII